MKLPRGQEIDVAVVIIEVVGQRNPEMDGCRELSLPFIPSGVFDDAQR